MFDVRGARAMTTSQAAGAAVLLDHVYRTYEVDDGVARGIEDVVAEIEPGRFITLTGPSGSGKTTLLNLVAALDRPDRGRVVVDGRDIGALSERAQAAYRLTTVGTVFQDAPLIPELSVGGNVAMPALLMGTRRPAVARRVDELLDRVGLASRGDDFPSQLSLGQRQRVALARALVNRPALLVADEPTGNLDRRTGQQILELIREINADGCTVLLVTHDPDVADAGDRQLRLVDGRLVEDRW